ncbi:hypothetical protein [Chengkuizengella marina]|uniref:Uncharacterized protein n=1 Tax=Chengkuizengella marina TaxID=2507566 RepID=A0A6N9Q990_9BACL|nr:hypothetical protein [Chengkuizengella marina]NBI31280.1 hypothetical protein [Chengkuizengella marina]
MEALREYILRKTGKTVEQFKKEVEESKSKSVTKTDIETLGAATLTSFQNQDELGELIMSLFIQVNDLATIVLQQQIELEGLKNVESL